MSDAIETVLTAQLKAIFDEGHSNIDEAAIDCGELGRRGRSVNLRMLAITS